MYHVIVRSLKCIVLIGMFGSFMYAKEAAVLEAFVKSAAALVEEKGDKAFHAFRQKGTKWFHDDQYIFVWYMEGLRYDYPPDVTGEGQNISALNDVDDKPVAEHMIEAASSKKGSCWVDYLWPKPKDVEKSQKSAYVKKVMIDGKMFIVCAGLYLD